MTSIKSHFWAHSTSVCNTGSWEWAWDKENTAYIMYMYDEMLIFFAGQSEGYLEIFHIPSTERHASIFQTFPLSGCSPRAVFCGNSDWSTLAHEVSSCVHQVRSSNSEVASQENYLKIIQLP